jgi:hypothetical protein
MSRRVIGAIIDTVLEIRERELGKEFLRTHFPKFAEKREAKWAQRAARRAKKQRQPDEGETFQHDEVKTMFPKNTMRKTGVGLVGVAPVIGYAAGIGARVFGFGDECTPEAIEAGCMTAEAAATAVTGLVTSAAGLVGGFLYWKGFNRAKARGE